MADISHYLNTTDDDILDPSTIKNIKAGAEMLIKHLAKNNDILIQVDPDADGFTSAAVLINYLYHYYPAFVINHVFYRLQNGKEHGIIPSTITDNIKLVIAPDSSSNSYEECEELANRNIDVLIIDHHEADKENKFACVINNQLCDYPTKTLSGVGMVYKFCSYLDSLLEQNYANELLDMVALGMVADMMPLTDFETVQLIRKGVKNIKNPFFEHMVEKQSFSLKGEVTPFGIAFYIAPYINATIRMGDTDEKLILFESMLNYKAYDLIESTKRGCKGQVESRVEQACRNCTNIKNRQTKSRDNSLEIIKHLIEEQNLLENKILLICLEPEYSLDKNLTGLIANQLMAEYQKPVMLLNKEIQDNGEINYEGSARGLSNSSFTNFRQFLLDSTLVNWAEGHAEAFGVSISQEDTIPFLNYSNEMLKDFNFSPVYKVDFIFNYNDMNPQEILNIASLKSIWGQGVTEPLIAVENIKITDNIQLMSKDKNPTLKITLPNGLSLIKFKSSEEEYQSLLSKNNIYLTINIVGKCEQNVWGGNVSPQIIIEDYEINHQLNYYF